MPSGRAGWHPVNIVVSGAPRPRTTLQRGVARRTVAGTNRLRDLVWIPDSSPESCRAPSRLSDRSGGKFNVLSPDHLAACGVTWIFVRQQALSAS